MGGQTKPPPVVDDPPEEPEEEDDEVALAPPLVEPPLEMPPVGPPVVPPPVEVAPTVPLALLNGSSDAGLVEQAAVSKAAQPARTAVHCIRGRLGH
jgi:hypothetical protein